MNHDHNDQQAKKIIIIGGGFAGLELARRLNNHPGVDILLLDKLTFHQFQPLFYQVATASIEATNVSFPLRKVFHNSRNVRIRITEVLAIRADEKLVETDIGNFAYDMLVLATGTKTNFFGNRQIESLAIPMKSTLDALRIMNRLINNFEDALNKASDQEKTHVMSVAIIGAGPTGVELAGALAEMRKHIVPKDYPELDAALMQIYLIDHNPNPLSAMSEASRKDARKYLEDMNVTLMLGTGVEQFDGKSLLLDNQERLFVKTVIWAAGVTGNVIGGFPSGVFARGNRLRVDDHHQVQGLADVYAIGDISSMETKNYPNGHPQLASVAKSQAEHLAKNIKAQLSGKAMKPYEFKNRGVMATIGKRKAVVDLDFPKLHIKGRLAWLIWMSLHLFLILGVKNKIQVFINWAYKYLTSDQSLRLAQRIKGKSEELETIKSEKP